MKSLIKILIYKCIVLLNVVLMFRNSYTCLSLDNCIYKLDSFENKYIELKNLKFNNPCTFIIDNLSILNDFKRFIIRSNNFNTNITIKLGYNIKRILYLDNKNLFNKDIEVLNLDKNRNYSFEYSNIDIELSLITEIFLNLRLIKKMMNIEDSKIYISFFVEKETDNIILENNPLKIQFFKSYDIFTSLNVYNNNTCCNKKHYYNIDISYHLKENQSINILIKFHEDKNKLIKYYFINDIIKGSVDINIFEYNDNDNLIDSFNISNKRIISYFKYDEITELNDKYYIVKITSLKSYSIGFLYSGNNIQCNNNLNDNSTKSKFIVLHNNESYSLEFINNNQNDNKNSNISKKIKFIALNNDNTLNNIINIGISSYTYSYSDYKQVVLNNNNMYYQHIFSKPTKITLKKEYSDANTSAIIYVSNLLYEINYNKVIDFERNKTYLLKGYSNNIINNSTNKNIEYEKILYVKLKYEVDSIIRINIIDNNTILKGIGYTLLKGDEIDVKNSAIEDKENLHNNKYYVNTKSIIMNKFILAKYAHVTIPYALESILIVKLNYMPSKIINYNNDNNSNNKFLSNNYTFSISFDSDISSSNDYDYIKNISTNTFIVILITFSILVVLVVILSFIINYFLYRKCKNKVDYEDVLIDSPINETSSKDKEDTI